MHLKYSQEHARFLFHPIQARIQQAMQSVRCPNEAFGSSALHQSVCSTMYLAIADSISLSKLQAGFRTVSESTVCNQLVLQNSKFYKEKSRRQKNQQALEVGKVYACLAASFLYQLKMKMIYGLRSHF